jgi:NitT/TauT family transport system substrate-binding protein
MSLRFVMARRRQILGAAGAGALLALSGPAAAEVDTVRIAQQFGVSYLPLQMMREHGLLEKHATEQGLGEITVEWLRFAGGSPMNDAILSGNLDFASGGVGPLLTIWDRTKGSLDVKGVAAINSMPLYLTTNQEDIQSIEDFTSDDRIALPSVKVSIQARTLQMAAEKELGRYDALDDITVSMPHPEGVAALTSGTEITGHFTSPPFQYQELQEPGVHRVLSSYDVLGGPATFNTVWTTASFRDDNPTVYQAFLGALEEAIEMINADKASAAEVYIRQTESRLDPEFVGQIVQDPEIEYTTVPINTMKYAEFMHKVGAIKNLPERWQDYFFEEIHGQKGS